MSSCRTSFMPVTGGMWRDIFLVSFLLLARAGQRARPVHDEARAIAVQRVRRDLPAAAIDFDRDAGRTTEHHAQGRPAFDTLHAACARDVVEQPLAARIVDLDPALA